MNFDSLNSAHAVAAFDAIQRAELEKKRRQDEILAAGAKANIENMELLRKQVELLEGQLEEVKERNRLLQELYDSSKQEAEGNRKDAIRNMVFGWVSFGVGTLIGIIGLVFSIVF